MTSAPSPDDEFARDVEAVRSEIHHIDRLRGKRQAILDAARKYGLSNLRVFGSVARGQANTGSDIDLLVDLDPRRTLLDLAGFKREVAELLDLRVDVATLDMLKGRLRDEILEEAQPL
jgi:uncharacterized protein